MEKSTKYGLALFVLVLVGGLFFIRGGADAGITGNVVANGVEGSGDVQKVIIGMQNYNYYPNTITVESGKPVEIFLDDSVYGCFRDFTIREFGIHEYLRTAEDSVTFTPTEKGTYTFACSMGMGTGKLVVK